LSAQGCQVQLKVSADSSDGKSSDGKSSDGKSSDGKRSDGKMEKVVIKSINC